MLDRGKLAVVTMFAVALAAAAFAWWWNYSRGQRALEFYKPKAAHLIRTAPQVEILFVGPPGRADAANSPVDSVPGWGTVIRKIDISKAPGLIHARTALLDDASYERHVPPTLQSFGPFFVRFRDGRDEVVLMFGWPDGRIIVVGSEDRSEQLIRKTADGWLGFIERNIKQADQQDKGEH